MDNALHRLISDIYAAALDADITQDVLRQICTLTDSPHGTLGYWNGHSAEFRSANYGNVLDGSERAQYLEMLPQDLDFQRRRNLPEGAAVLGEAFVPLAERKRSEVFQFHRRIGCVHLLALPVLRRPGLLVDVSVYRPETSEPHSDRDAKFLDLLAPHMQRSFAMAGQFATLRGKAALFESTLSQLAVPVLLVNASGTLIFANPSGEALLTLNDPLGVARGRLVVADTNRDRWRALVERLALDNPEGTATVLGTKAGNTVPVLAIPLATRQTEDLGLAPTTQNAGLVIFSPSGQLPKDLSWVLRATYGLTPAESRLAAGLARGLALRDYAKQEHRSLNTVRTQLKAVFAKTGTSRQTDLVRLVAALPSASLNKPEHN